ncbi:unnamed protein product [Parnassius apollo]|uniref:(apollo) hypothetical protein n=1 Tax=Parnassius apollo TaxID=110799 RepID=A0A8S3YDY0_PARAO|nr:unnamed protein product [Parnassius apollo]
MLEAVMSDNEDNVAVESDASIDDDYVEESDHDSMSEQNASSSEESEAEETETQERFFLAKDKITKWFKIKSRADMDAVPVPQDRTAIATPYRRQEAFGAIPDTAPCGANAFAHDTL